MSYGRMNIWLRYNDCRIITDCWRTDLVIKTCGGQYLLEMECGDSVLKKIKEKLPDYSVTAEDYMGERTIRIVKPGGYPANKEHHINNIVVDVPPGCYMVWTRICYSGNEDTNQVMVIVDCGVEACVNLLLPTVEKCGGGFVFPFVLRAVEMGIARADIVAGARAIIGVANIKPKDFNAELNLRAAEAREMKIPDLQKKIVQVQEMFKGMD